MLSLRAALKHSCILLSPESPSPAEHPAHTRLAVSPWGGVNVETNLNYAKALNCALTVEGVRGSIFVAPVWQTCVRGCAGLQGSLSTEITLTFLSQLDSYSISASWPSLIFWGKLKNIVHIFKHIYSSLISPCSVVHYHWCKKSICLWIGNFIRKEQTTLLT